MKFHVTVNRDTVYEIDADDEQDAIDAVLDGEGIEVDGTTNGAHAEPADEPHEPAANRCATCGCDLHNGICPEGHEQTGGDA